MEYRPCASNPAEYASRHPVGDPESHSYDVESEEHISFVARNAVPKATLCEIESATAKDPMLQAVKSAVESGCWHKAPSDVSLSELSRYEQVKEQLTCSDTVLLKSDRLVVPAMLQERVVDIAHEGHLGIVKTKALLREGVVSMHGQNGTNKGQGLLTISSGYPSLPKRTASDVSVS